MVLPVPVPGLVIRYFYLWRSAVEAGREEADKARPAVIVLAAAAPAGKPPRVVVAPTTHSDPGADRGVEIPRQVKANLGLDGERSWIVTDDLNSFEWPGFDLDRLPGTSGRYAYGHIPAKLFHRVRDAILAHRPPVRFTPRP